MLLFVTKSDISTKITKDISDTCSESAVTSAKKNPGKKIESRIASLWKRVEDTKKKDVVPEFVVPETGVGSLGTLTTGSKLTIK